MFKAVIFDMDGLLVDSEIYWHQLEQDIVKSLGIEYTENLAKEMLGVSLVDMTKVFQKYNEQVTFEQVYELFDDGADQVYTQDSNLLPGAEELLKFLQEKGIKMAIASSSPQRWISLFLDKFDLKKYFQFEFSTQSMNLPGKPDPAIYNECIEKFGIKSEETVIFEDSLVGNQAAKASGAFTVAVPDERWDFGDFSFADLVADSLEDEKIYKLFEKG